MKETKGELFNILLVEDNPGHAELVRRSFNDNRVANKLFVVDDGEKALDYLFQRNAYADQNQFPKPHVVLLDLRLPKIDGLEVLKQVKQSKDLAKLPVVILTTSASEEDTAKAYEYNANSYVVKPVNFLKFTELMKDLGFYWLGWNHYPWA